MKHTKTFLALALAGLSGAAFAQYTSPELMLVTDFGGTTPNGATVPAQIERYDPYTGDYLGAFGAGYVTDPYGIAVVGTDAYVSNPFVYAGNYFSRIDKFNFSTGAYDGSIFSTGPYNISGLATYGSNLLATDYGDGSFNNGGVYTYNSSGQQTGFYGLANGTVANSIATDSSHSYIATGGGAGLLSYNLDANGLTTGLHFQNGNGIGKIYFGVASLASANTVFTCGHATSGSSATIIDAYSETTGGLIGEYSNTNDERLISLAFGHNGMLYALDETTDQVQRFDATTAIAYGPLGSFAINDTADPISLAVYAAPEPVSMFGLGLGIAGLLVRRRRRQS